MSFNSRQYQWKDIRINLSGRSLVGVKEIKYKRSKEKEPLYGRGNKVLSIQHGNETIEGTITLLQSELEALTAAVKQIDPVGSVLDYDYDCVVSYGVGVDLKTDIVLGLSFTEYEKGMEQTDKMMEIEMPFIAREIQESK